MKKRPPPTVDEDEIALFREEMHGVKPLLDDRMEPYRKRRRPIPVQSQDNARRITEEALQFSTQTLEVETGEELHFSRPGVQHSLMKRLRKGMHTIQAELDLHGMTVAQARPELAAFLFHCRERGLRCVRIIHGKGHGSKDRQPVLKHNVNNWLRQRDEVLAFCTARPQDGGTGAIYLLLRR